jgi:hypothetical protein
LLPITLRRYYVEPDLIHAILTATGDCGETDTVKGLGDGKKSAVAL